LKKQRKLTRAEDVNLSLKNLKRITNKARHLLLVDDNPFNLMAASFILEKLGFIIHKAFNGKQCIEMLENSMKTNVKYHLILTDIQMPIMDGLEMSKEIKRRIQMNEIYYVPIIAITAQTVSEEEKMSYQESGINCILGKPLVPEEINRSIKALFN